MIFGSKFFKNIHLALDFLTEERQRSDKLVDRHDVLLDVCESLIRTKFHYHILGRSVFHSSDRSTTIIQSTYFSFAIIMEWLEIQSAMMSASKDLVNRQCRYFGYPMEMAIRLGYIHTVRMLAEAGAEIYNEKIFSFHIAIREPARGGHAEVIDYFLHEPIPLLRYSTLRIWQDLADEAAAHGHPHISMTIVVKHGELLGKRSLHMILCKRGCSWK